MAEAGQIDVRLCDRYIIEDGLSRHWGGGPINLRRPATDFRFELCGMFEVGRIIPNPPFRIPAGTKHFPVDGALRIGMCSADGLHFLLTG